jgi:hypothetical protein
MWTKPVLGKIDFEGNSGTLGFAMNSYTGLFEPPSVPGSGPEIVRTLRAYNKALPIAFLAHVLRRSVAEIEAEVRRLESFHAVQKDGDQVRLAA